MLIATAGLPGSGKSTIAAQIGAALKCAVVSVDPIESAIVAAGIDPDQPTGLAAYLVAETIAESVLSSGQTIIVDAVNAVEPARHQWIALAERQQVELRFIEVQCLDVDVHQARLEARVSKLPHPAEATSYAVEQSLEEYAAWTGRTASVRRVTIDTSRPLESNVAAALAFLRE